MEIQMTRKEELVSVYWDFYKEVNNVRPRWINFDSLTEDELEGMLNDLNAQAKIVWAQREAEDQQAVKDFEASIVRIMKAGAHSQEDALRWLMEASECNGDWEYFAYQNGLPYGFFRK